jgi:hypothetical protein
MKSYEPARDEQFKQLARERLVVGDLFTYDVSVVTIMTEGRYYGALSRAVTATGVTLPKLALGCAEYVETTPGKGFVFLALWNDGNVYSPKLVYDCTRACIKQGSRHKLAKLALPLLGGNERARFIGAMEQAVDHAEDDADERDEHMPEVVFVTDHELL